MGRKPRVEGVLDNGDVGRHAGDERGGLKAVEVGEGVRLHHSEIARAQVRPQPVGRAGRKARVEEACDEGEHRTDAHVGALAEDEVEVAVGNANVDDVGHEDGDDHLKGALDDDEEHAENGVGAVAAEVTDDAAELMHGGPPGERGAAGAGAGTAGSAMGLGSAPADAGGAAAGLASATVTAAPAASSPRRHRRRGIFRRCRRRLEPAAVRTQVRVGAPQVIGKSLALLGRKASEHGLGLLSAGRVPCAGHTRALRRERDHLRATVGRMRLNLYKPLARQRVEHARHTRRVEFVEVRHVARRARTVFGKVREKLGLARAKPDARHKGVHKLPLGMTRTEK